jgi:hypothetical protein
VLQTAAVSSSLTEETFPQSSVNQGASDTELRCINHPSSSSKPGTGHCLLKENLMWQQEKTKNTKEKKIVISVFGTRRVNFVN